MPYSSFMSYNYNLFTCFVLLNLNNDVLGYVLFVFLSDLLDKVLYRLNSS